MDDRGHAKYTDRPYSIIVDEVSTGGVNSNSEHAFGAILAFKPQNFNRKKNIAIFSASVNSKGPIRFYTGHSEGVRFVNNTTIPVPTELRQMGRLTIEEQENSLLDPYLGYTNPKIIKKVNEEAFFRRFISNSSNRLLKDFITHTGNHYRDERGQLQDNTAGYFRLMDENFVTDNAMINSMFPYHKEVRRLMPDPFEIIEYQDFTIEERQFIEDVYQKYLEKIGDFVSETISTCNTMITSFTKRIEDLETPQETHKKSTKTPQKTHKKSTKTVSSNEERTDAERERKRLSERIQRVREYLYYIMDTLDDSLENFVKKHNDGTFNSPIIGTNVTVSDNSIQEALKEIITDNHMSTEFHQYELIKENIKFLHSLVHWVHIQSTKKAREEGYLKLPARIGRNSFRHYEDELNTIRSCKYYTMVGTRNNDAVMKSIYKPVVEKIGTIITSFYEKNQKHFNAAQQKDYTKKPDEREETAKKLHQEYEATMKLVDDQREQFNQRYGASGKVFENHIKIQAAEGHRWRDVTTFEEWLHFMQRQEANKGPGGRKTEFTNIGRGPFFQEIKKAETENINLKRSKKEEEYLKREDDRAQERSDSDEEEDIERKETRTTKETTDAETLALAQQTGPSGKKSTFNAKRRGDSNLSILSAYNNYNKREKPEELAKKTLEKILQDLNQECNKIISQYMFVHQRPVRLSAEQVQKFKLQEIYEYIGVYAPKNTDEVPREGKYNRLFCGRECSRALDCPLEAVIFTQSVDDNGDQKEGYFNTDDILQMSGRCGRPSKSIISVVYMTDTTYIKCLTGDTTSNISNPLLRYKYYRQDSKSTSINDPMIGYPNKDKNIADANTEYYTTRVFKLLDKMIKGTEF